MEIECTVKHITHQSADQRWGVIQCRDIDNKKFTATGSVGSVENGMCLKLIGNWKEHATYGKQFQVDAWTEELPKSPEGIREYLAGTVDGIGPKLATEIVRTFGSKALEIIKKDPERLREVKGIGKGKKKFNNILEGLKKSEEAQDVLIFFGQYGVTQNLAFKIFEHYRKNHPEKDIVKEVRKNPYQLIDEMRGIGFRTADNIALAIGFEKSDPTRLHEGLKYTLGCLGDEGHVYAQHQQLIDKASELLEITKKEAEEAIEVNLLTKTIIEDGDAIYLQQYYFAEKNVARDLLFIRDTKAKNEHLVADIRKIEKETGTELDETQAEAVQCAIENKVMILTGGPGTGKTTTTKAVIKALTDNQLKVLLAAPTGRAAKRMSEATGKEAMTIHRLLEYNPTDGFKKNAENPLDGDVLIVDEASMIDILLMQSLMDAIPAKMRLIFVGDVNQLPSVGAGNVLRDLIVKNLQ